jgi:hypothetical protein
MARNFNAKNYKNGMYFHCQKLQKLHVFLLPEPIKMECTFIARNYENGMYFHCQKQQTWLEFSLQKL